MGRPKNRQRPARPTGAREGSHHGREAIARLASAVADAELEWSHLRTVWATEQSDEMAIARREEAPGISSLICDLYMRLFWLARMAPDASAAETSPGRRGPTTGRDEPNERLRDTDAAGFSP